MVVSFKPFQVSPVIVNKAGAYPRVGAPKDTSFTQAATLLTNIGQGWKGLTGINNLAYYEHS